MQGLTLLRLAVIMPGVVKTSGDCATFEASANILVGTSSHRLDRFILLLRRTRYCRRHCRALWCASFQIAGLGARSGARSGDSSGDAAAPDDAADNGAEDEEDAQHDDDD